MKDAVNKRIIQFLKTNNITISKAAEILGSTQSTLSNKLNGRYRVDIDTIVLLLTIYEDLSPDWLLLGRGPMLRPSQISNNVNGDIGGDNIQGSRVSVRKNDSQMVDTLQRQLEEEKQRNREYWNTIQTLINK